MKDDKAINMQRTVWWCGAATYLPEEWKDGVSKWMLVHYEKERPFIARFSFMHSYWQDVYLHQIDVTSWMPLPKP